MAKRKIKFNWYRLIIQWAILGLLGYMVIKAWTDSDYNPDYEAYCPFGGLLALGSWLINNTLACTMTSVQIVMGVIFAIGIILFSKLFCGFICPIGTITEWLGKTGNVFKIRYSIRGFADRLLRILKYALLFITIYFTLSSSELFCKQYDPFYAIFTWFSYDVNFLYAIIAIAITILGSIFIRQFWCKYLCPLAAISNIFTYFILFAIVIGTYIILVISEIEISWIVPLSVIIILAYLLEAFKLKGWLFPLFRITRQDDDCNHCKLCDKACPQGIIISKGDEKIKHIDCNLCGDCLTVCPDKESLKLNRIRMRWFPSVITVILVIIGVYLGTTVEVPTVDERWGSEEEFENAEIFRKSGLKNIKCYGASMGFVSQMHEVEGVLGVATYVGSNSVKIYYNPDVINEKQLITIIFSPVKYIIKKDDTIPQQLKIVTIGINKFFDRYDSFYLSELLEQVDAIYGYETEYGEPVIARIYYDDRAIVPEKIKKIIESKEVTYMMQGEQFTEAINFTVDYIDNKIITIDRSDFRKKMFEPYTEYFYEIESNDNTLVYEISMLQATEPDMVSWMPYLGSHLSSVSGIVSFETVFITEPMAQIRFYPEITNKDSLYNYLIKDSLFIMYDNGETEMVPNPFVFEKKGKVVDN